MTETRALVSFRASSDTIPRKNRRLSLNLVEEALTRTDTMKASRQQTTSVQTSKAHKATKKNQRETEETPLKARTAATAAAHARRSGF